MRFLTDKDVDNRAVLDHVLPEYQKLNEAPTSVEQLPGYSSSFTAKELSTFKTTAMAEERHRRYKGMDAHRNILLFDNPWARLIETRDDGTCWVVRPKPQFVMTYEEAKRRAAQLIVHTTSSNSTDPSDSLPQDLGSTSPVNY